MQPYFPVCRPSSWFHTVICCRDHTYSLSVTRCSASPLAVASLRYESLVFASVCARACVCVGVCFCFCLRAWQASGISTCRFACCSIFLLGLLPDKTVWIQAYVYQCVHERACVCVSQYELRVLSPDQRQLHSTWSQHITITWHSIKQKTCQTQLDVVDF